MEFRRKTSNGLSNTLVRLLIKSAIVLIIISIIIIVLDNIELPSPHKFIQKKILNEHFKVLK